MSWVKLCKNRMRERIAPGIPSIVLKSETPTRFLIALAGNANYSNEKYNKMSWVDRLFNFFKFMVALSETSIESLTAFKGFQADGFENVYQTSQKLCGLIYSIVSKTDTKYLSMEPLAYRNG